MLWLLLVVVVANWYVLLLLLLRGVVVDVFGKFLLLGGVVIVSSRLYALFWRHACVAGGQSEGGVRGAGGTVPDILWVNLAA